MKLSITDIQKMADPSHTQRIKSKAIKDIIYDAFLTIQ